MKADLFLKKFRERSSRLATPTLMVRRNNRGCTSLSAARIEGTAYTQHGCYTIGSECTTQENSLILEANTKMRKTPMPRLISSHVVSIFVSVCE